MQDEKFLESLQGPDNCGSCDQDKGKTRLCWCCLANRETIRKIRRFMCPCMPRRYVLSLMMFLGGLAFVPHRINIGVTIVAMVANQTDKGGNITRPREDEDVFDWSPQVQGFILGAFFYGYVLLQIPAGYLAMRHGGHYPFGVAVFVSSILSLLTPISTRQHPYMLVMIRFLQGLSQGFTTPVFPAIVTRWAPSHEKSLIATLSMSGLTGGIVVGPAMAGILTDTLGWQAVFYVQGGIALVWCVFWVLLTSETPQEDPSIMKDELELFRKECVHTDTAGLTSSNPIPWRQILTSAPFWAILFNLVAWNWLLLLTVNTIPTYLNKVHGYNVSRAGLFLSLPFLLQVFIGPATGWTADLMRRKGVSTTVVRKLHNTIGLSSYALFFLALAFNTSDKGAIAALVIGVGFASVSLACIQVVPIDVAGRYASLIFSIGNCVGILIGASGPPFVGFVVANQAVAEWRIVFLTSAAVAVVNIVLFLLLGSGERQSWSDSNEDLESKGLDQAESLA